MADDTLCDFDSVDLIGQPWHGIVSGGKLTLANGKTRDYKGAVPASADAFIVKVPEQPEVVTSGADAADGMRWLNYAVISGRNHVFYGRELGPLSWIYIDPAKRSWLVTIGVDYRNVGRLAFVDINNNAISHAIDIALDGVGGYCVIASASDARDGFGGWLSYNDLAVVDVSSTGRDVIFSRQKASSGDVSTRTWTYRYPNTYGIKSDSRTGYEPAAFFRLQISGIPGDPSNAVAAVFTTLVGRIRRGEYSGDDSSAFLTPTLDDIKFNGYGLQGQPAALAASRKIGSTHYSGGSATAYYRFWRGEEMLACTPVAQVIQPGTRVQCSGGGFTEQLICVAGFMFLPNDQLIPVLLLVDIEVSDVTSVHEFSSIEESHGVGSGYSADAGHYQNAAALRPVSLSLNIKISYKLRIGDHVSAPLVLFLATSNGSSQSGGQLGVTNHNRLPSHVTFSPLPEVLTGHLEASADNGWVEVLPIGDTRQPAISHGAVTRGLAAGWNFDTSFDGALLGVWNEQLVDGFIEKGGWDAGVALPEAVDFYYNVLLDVAWPLQKGLVTRYSNKAYGLCGRHLDGRWRFTSPLTISGGGVEWLIHDSSTPPSVAVDPDSGEVFISLDRDKYPLCFV